MRILSQKWVESEHLPAQRKAVEEAKKTRRKTPVFLMRGIGLGDVVEVVAKPIALVIDRATAALGRDADSLVAWVVRPWTRIDTKFAKKWATKLAAGCSACSKRRAWLNIVVPNVWAWRHWLHAWRRVLSGWRSVYRCSVSRGLNGARKAP